MKKNPKTTPTHIINNTTKSVFNFVVANKAVFAFIKDPTHTEVPGVLAFVYAIVGLLLIGTAIFGIGFVSFKKFGPSVIDYYEKVKNWAIDTSLSGVRDISDKAYEREQLRLKKALEVKPNVVVSQVSNVAQTGVAAAGGLISKVFNFLGSTGTSLSIPVIPFLYSFQVNAGTNFRAMIFNILLEYMKKIISLLYNDTLQPFFKKHFSGQNEDTITQKILDSILLFYYSLLQKHAKANPEDNKVKDMKQYLDKLLLLKLYKTQGEHNEKFFQKISTAGPEQITNLMAELNYAGPRYFLKTLHQYNSDAVDEQDSYSNYESM
jgi:hypothetical protein